MVNSVVEKPIWIIKLGGSIITEDTEFMTPREDIIANVLLLLSEFMNQYQFVMFTVPALSVTH
jgi:isopentenyl phosphate kinase